MVTVFVHSGMLIHCAHSGEAAGDGDGLTRDTPEMLKRNLQQFGEETNKCSKVHPFFFFLIKNLSNHLKKEKTECLWLR